MDVVDPYFFFLDKTDNILITDSSSNCIHIYNTDFQLVHEISVSHYAMGITVDLKGRVIVVCQSITNCLQIFDLVTNLLLLLCVTYSLLVFVKFT